MGTEPIMQVLIAALADYANVTQDGKLNVMGAFDTIIAKQFPAVLPLAVIALRLTLDYEDRSAAHSLELVIVNQDGREFGKLEGRLEVPQIPPGQRATVNQVLTLQQLSFDRPDRFSVVIRWDGEERQRLPLDVVAVPASPQG